MRVGSHALMRCTSSTQGFRVKLAQTGEFGWNHGRSDATGALAYGRPSKYPNHREPMARSHFRVVPPFAEIVLIRCKTIRTTND